MKKTLKTENPEIDVLITGNDHNLIKKGIMEIVGRPVDKNGKPIKGLGPRRRKVRSLAELPFACDYVRNELIKAINKRNRNEVNRKAVPKKNVLDYSLPMVQAFEIVEGSDAFENEWAESTRKYYFSIFRRQVLPEIQYCTDEEDFTVLELEDLKEKIMEKSLRNGNSRQNLAQTEAQTNTKIQAAGRIYNAMRDIDNTLPVLTLLSQKCRKDFTVTEHMKWMPIERIIELRILIEDILEKDPCLARAAAAMISAALRTGEAAGLTKEFIYDNGEYMVLEVAQQERDGRLTQSLKTEAAYRKVMPDSWGRRIISAANELINDDTTNAPITKKRLSDNIKKWLLTIGIDDIFLEWLKKDMGNNPDRDANGIPSNDVIAYLLRKIVTNIWSNIYGLTKEEVDYLLGHARYTKGKAKINPSHRKTFDDLWAKICKIKLDPADDCNEKMHSIGAYNTLSVVGDEIYMNDSNKTITVCLTLENEEPGESYCLTTQGNYVCVKDVLAEGFEGIRKRTTIMEAIIVEEERYGKD